jgi:hypothetical protein
MSMHEINPGIYQLKLQCKRRVLIFSRHRLIATIAFITIVLVGCGKNVDPAGPAATATKPEEVAAPTTEPALQPALVALQQGDKSTAVNRFVESNWNARPLFPAGSVLNLTETQFASLPAGDRDVKAQETLTQLSALKELAAAVDKAGLDALARKDNSQARKYFTSLKQCGEACNAGDSLKMLQLVGQALTKRADAGLAKTNP